MNVGRERALYRWSGCVGSSASAVWIQGPTPTDVDRIRALPRRSAAYAALEAQLRPPESLEADRGAIPLDPLGR